MLPIYQDYFLYKPASFQETKKIKIVLMTKYFQYTLIPFGVILASACSTDSSILPQRKDIVDAVFASGSIATKNEYNVTAYMDGYLDSSYVVEGDSVTKGNVLFKIKNDVQREELDNALVNYRFARRNNETDAPRLRQQQALVMEALKTLATDSINYVRYSQLVKTKAVARAEFEKVELEFNNAKSDLLVQEQALADLRRNLSLDVDNSKSQLAIQRQNDLYYYLHGESPGRINQVFKKNGDLLKRGDAIAQVGTGAIVARLLIAEEDINRVTLGQMTFLSLNSAREKLYPAHVTKIYPAFDNVNQAFTVEATFDVLPYDLKDGTQLQANILVGEKNHAMVIPSQYLLAGDSVILDQGKRKVAVQAGIRTMEWTEIIAGLAENNRIILSK
jgi:multidrug efflux pump subunit AcrA (membrane-fusion protein)